MIQVEDTLSESPPLPDSGWGRRRRGTWRVPLIFGISAVLFAWGVAGASASAVQHGSPLPGGATATAGPTFPSPVQHVIIVMLENEPSSAVLANGPYEKSLAQKYVYADSFYAVSHPSAPNYLSATAGSYFGNANSDAYHVYTAVNVGDLLERAHMTWGMFAESMPKPCDTHSGGLYDVSHVPFLFYQDVVGNPTRCDADVTGFSQWNADVASGNIPNYSFITPNLLHDGHTPGASAGIANADKWLSSWLSPLVTKPWFSSTVVFVLYDESADSDTSGYNGNHGGHVYLTIVSPLVRMGTTYTSLACDYDLLVTVEWLFGLGNTGHQDANSGKWPAFKSAFTFTPS